MSQYKIHPKDSDPAILDQVGKALSERMGKLYNANDSVLLLKEYSSGQIWVALDHSAYEGKVFFEEYSSNYRHSLNAIFYIACELAGVEFSVNEFESYVFSSANDLAKALDAITADPAKKILPPTNSTQPDAKAAGIVGTEKTI